MNDIKHMYLFEPVLLNDMEIHWELLTIELIAKEMGDHKLAKEASLLKNKILEKIENGSY